jgi:glutathione S-transferase/RNA polymerase-associated protein
MKKGIPFEATTPIGAGGVEPEFAQASPRGEVPMLVDGAAKIFDSTIICEYLEDKYPQKPLRPSSAEERARVRMLEDTLDTIYEGVTWAVFEIEGWGRATGELRTVLLKRAAEQIANFNRWLERELGNRTWFNGEDRKGVACAYPFVAGAAGQATCPRARSQRGGARWSGRASSAAGHRQRTGRHGLEVPQMLKSGIFKREYRDHRSADDAQRACRSSSTAWKNNIRFSNEATGEKIPMEGTAKPSYLGLLMRSYRRGPRAPVSVVLAARRLTPT